MLTIDMSGLGIICGNQKRKLERYIPNCEFKQRKSYDEYYIPSSVDVELGVSDLMVLAESFNVTVECNLIVLSN